MTKQEAIKGHRKMWSWIVEQLEKSSKPMNISNLKRQWCTNNALKLYNDCFACEYIKQEYGGNNCMYCPIDWGEKKSCLDLYGIVLRNDMGLLTQIEAAEVIANMPTKENNKQY